MAARYLKLYLTQIVSRHPRDKNANTLKTRNVRFWKTTSFTLMQSFRLINLNIKVHPFEFSVTLCEECLILVLWLVAGGWWLVVGG